MLFIWSSQSCEEHRMQSSVKIPCTLLMCPLCLLLLENAYESGVGGRIYMVNLHACTPCLPPLVSMGGAWVGLDSRISHRVGARDAKESLGDIWLMVNPSLFCAFKLYFYLSPDHWLLYPINLLRSSAFPNEPPSPQSFIPIPPSLHYQNSCSNSCCQGTHLLPFHSLSTCCSLASAPLLLVELPVSVNPMCNGLSHHLFETSDTVDPGLSPETLSSLSRCDNILCSPSSFCDTAFLVLCSFSSTHPLNAGWTPICFCLYL